MGSHKDAEIDAISKITRIVDKLSCVQAERVLEFVQRRINEKNNQQIMQSSKGFYGSLRGISEMDLPTQEDMSAKMEAAKRNYGG